MKNFRMFMITAAACLSAATFLTSCEDDDRSIPTDNSGIAGTFRITSFNAPATDLNEDGTASTNFLTETDCYNDNYLKLNANHTYAMTDNYLDGAGGLPECLAYVETGTWNREGDVITTSSSTSNGFESRDVIYTYSESAGTLTNTNSETEGIYPGYDVDGNFGNQTGATSYVYTREAVQ